MEVLAKVMVFVTILFVIFGFVFGRDPDGWGYEFSFQMALPWFSIAIASGVCSMVLFWMATVQKKLEELCQTNKAILDELVSRHLSDEMSSKKEVKQSILAQEKESPSFENIHEGW